MRAQAWLNEVAVRDAAPAPAASAGKKRSRASKADAERRRVSEDFASTSGSGGKDGAAKAGAKVGAKAGAKGGGGRARGSEDKPTKKNPRGSARLRWTPDLHRDFLKAVNQLGGLELATPKGIMTLMTTSGMTQQHIKSHLQKYRLQEIGSVKKEDLDDNEERKRRAMIKRVRAEQAEELKRRASVGDLASLEASTRAPLRESELETPGESRSLSNLVGSMGPPIQHTPMHSLDAILAQALCSPATSAALTPPSFAALESAAPTLDASLMSSHVVADMPHIGEALLKQLEMQKQLHDQLLAQRRLENAIQEHSRYLATILSRPALDAVDAAPDASATD